MPTQGAHLPVLTYFQRRKPYSSGGDPSVSGSGYGHGVSPTPDASVARALLDASAAPLLPAARDTLLAALDAGWADPRRLHAEGRQARALLDRAREVVAAGLGVRPARAVLPALGPGRAASRVRGAAARRAPPRAPGWSPRPSSTRPSSPSAATSRPRPATPTASRRSRWTGWAGSTSRRSSRALAAAGDGGRGGADAPTARSARGSRWPGRGSAPAARGVPLLVDAQASLGRDAAPTAYDVLAGDARSWGGPGGVGVLVVPERTRWRRPGPASELEGGRTDAEPVVALALAAAEAWQQTEATRADRAGARRRAGRPDPRRGRGHPRHRGRRRPGRPAAARGDLLLPVRRRRGARGRAGPAGVRRGVRLGLHLQHARAEPRPGGDGRAHPRQRAGHPAAGGRGARAAPPTWSGSSRCCPTRWRPSAPSSGRPGL